MKFTETNLKGGFVIELEERRDERGFFARAFCQDEFAAHGLKTEFVQCNLSHNIKRGTLRGLHFQLKPHEEVKFVRCVRGAILDVMIDLRPDSPTKLKYFAAELTGENNKALYIPEGFAHGYIALEDDSLVYYQVSERYTPGAERTVRYDDPDININWPDIKPLIVSAKDQAAPFYRDIKFN